MNWQESAEGEIHVTKPEKYMLSNQKNTAKKMEVLCTKCCAAHESAWGRDTCHKISEIHPIVSNQKNTAKKMRALCTKCCAAHESAGIRGGRRRKTGGRGRRGIWGSTYTSQPGIWVAAWSVKCCILYSVFLYSCTFYFCSTYAS